MTCLQRLQHSLACTAQQWLSARRTRKGVGRGKERKVPWQAQRVQHSVPCYVILSPSLSHLTSPDNWLFATITFAPIALTPVVFTLASPGPPPSSHLDNNEMITTIVGLSFCHQCHDCFCSHCFHLHCPHLHHLHSGIP